MTVKIVVYLDEVRYETDLETARTFIDAVLEVKRLSNLLEDAEHLAREIEEAIKDGRKYDPYEHLILDVGTDTCTDIDVEGTTLTLS